MARKKVSIDQAQLLDDIKDAIDTLRYISTAPSKRRALAARELIEYLELHYTGEK